MDHYENFPVASWLCPPELRAPILALYGFARTADDLADEGDATADERLQALAQYRAHVHQACQHPDFLSDSWPEVFLALGREHQRWHFPMGLLEDLLNAFEQDVIYTHEKRVYRDRAQLLDYCRRSANPIGRLLLHLYGVKDAHSRQQSDAICSALQLINFWQDLSIDLPRGRNYLPVGADLAEEVAFARALMHQGAALVHALPGRGGWELRLVVQGGLRILDKIERCNTLLERPRLHGSDYGLMLWRAAWMTQSRP